MTDPEPHILVVDDHEDIRESLARYLTRNGYRTSVAENSAVARRVLANAAIDLIVLDVMMPGEDGLSLCRHVYEQLDIPVILLTAMAEETDRIIGLEIGADDYVSKPFNPRELLARVRSVLRRGRRVNPPAQDHEFKRVRFDRWTFDLGRRELIDEDAISVPLSATEFALLSAFAERPGTTLSRHQLLDLTQGRSASLFDRSIDNHISRLRRKLERDPSSPELIKTVWGRGYVFSTRVEPVA